LEIRGQLLHHEPMCLHTSLKVGGPADLFAIPEDAEDLQNLLSWLGHQNIPWLPIGRGYNLLVRDKGIRGAVISLERFNRISSVSGPLVRAETGAENLAVVRFAQKMELGGIGFISGIPGTIGGAIKMNAGAYGEGILERTEHLTLLRGGKVADFRMDELDYGYRHLHLADGDIVLAATFKLEDRERHLTEVEIQKDLELRRTKHNVGFPSAGSFFKNPHGQAAWRLIDDAGLRGIRIGGAQVSGVHSNFLVNAGDATAQNFLDLSAKVKNAVYATSGVTLEEEVRIVGEI
jgi:UDP-N-acetylmuramate dehydrogenase